VEKLQPILHPIRTLFFLVFVGLLALVAAAPVVIVLSVWLSAVVTVLSIVVPLAFLGFLVWAPYQLLSRHSDVALRNIRRTAETFAEAMFLVPLRVTAGIGRAGARVVHGAVAVGRPLGRVLFDTASCAALSALLAAPIAFFHSSPELLVPVVAAIGGTMGFGIGVVRAWRDRKSRTVEVKHKTGPEQEVLAGRA